MPNQALRMSFSCNIAIPPGTAIQSKNFPNCPLPLPSQPGRAAANLWPRSPSLLILARSDAAKRVETERKKIQIARRTRLIRTIQNLNLACESPQPARAGCLIFSASRFAGDLELGQRYAVTFYSNLRISTGRMRAAERAGRIVAATLMASAAAAIQIASKPFARNGT